MPVSRYQELAEIAQRAEEGRDKRNAEAREFIGEFFKKFADYCGMPLDRLKLLPWVEETKNFQAKTDGVHGLWQAVHFDEDKEEWGVGVCIVLTPPESFSRRSVAATMWVKEDDGRYSMRFGSQSYPNLNLNVQTMYEPVFAAVFAEMKAAFKGTRKNANAKYGFQIEAANA